MGMKKKQCLNDNKHNHEASQVALVVKNLPASAGDPGSIPGLERSPGGGHGNPLQYACLENSHGQRSLAGYSSWGRKESDTVKHGTFLVYFRILFLWHYFN